MPRPKDDGLKYFPFDVTFFHDYKIRSLHGKYGHKGIVLYMYLLCEIYANGYYLPLTDELVEFVAGDLNLTEDLTRQIIAYLFSRSLLDSTLAESVKVLSAKSIQRRYQEAKRGLKRDVVVEAKYWLLEKAETLGFIKVRPENGFSEINEDNSEIYSNKSEKNDTKESKGKENKIKESKAESPPSASLTAENRKILIDQYGKAVVDKYQKKFEDWRTSRKAYKADAYKTISDWLQKDMPKQKGNEHSSFRAEDVDKAIVAKYKKIGGKKDNDEV